MMPPPPLVAIAGWVVPGAGYWLIGQRLRGLVVGVTILLLFVGGLLIGGMRVIDSPFIEAADERAQRQQDEALARKENANYAPPSVVVRLLHQKPWFIPQIVAGPIALAANYVAVNWGSHVDPGSLREAQGVAPSHARVNEIGVLYTAVAGMLNLMAIIDSAYRAANEGAR
jgi:hypothetical protein